MAPQNHYEAYYLAQAGSGISRVYTGTPHQRGSGIASFLKCIVRTVYPLIKDAGSAVLGEAARAGVKVLDDVTSGRASLRESVHRHVNAADANLRAALKRKSQKLQGGAGYKKPRTASGPHLHRTIRAVQSKKKNKKPLFKADIFGKKK